MTATPNFDERAIAVAQVVRDVIRPVDIFLFGSRARGDWRDASDIDIENNAGARLPRYTPGRRA